VPHVTPSIAACGQNAAAVSIPPLLTQENSMKSMSLKSFVARVATAMMFGMPVPALYIIGADPAEAQTIKSQSVGQEVALALQQEQQASQLAAQGRTADAEALYKQSLAAMEQSMPGDPILAGSLNNVAQFYRAQNRFGEAAELYNRALAIYVASYGDNHTLTATVINNLAGTYLADRKFDAAEPLYRRGLAASEKLLGPEHYGIAVSLDWLAQTHFRQGHAAEAEAELKRGVAIAEKATGPESQLVVKLLDHLISVVKAQGRTQEASALTERAQQIIAKSRK
jgi:tetratricopeptide (TPR) repeat protein